MRFYIPLGKHLLGINLRISLKKREGNDVLAIANKMDHRYCTFLDYDYTEELTLDADIKGLQKKFNLGNAYVFKTLNGFHVIFLDLLTYEEVNKVLDASSCDEHYKYVSRKNNNRQWVLRITPKKNKNVSKFYKVVKSSHERPLSFPHSNYLLAQGVSPGTISKLDPLFEGHDMNLTFVRYRA